MTDLQLAGMLDRLYARWLAGAGDGLSDEAIPAAWRSGHGLAQSHLLAVAGQCRQFLAESTLPVDLRPAPAFPTAELALLPDALRLRFRRCRDNMPPDLWMDLLQLMAERGFQAHPFDWLPDAPNERLPVVYDTWVAWRQQLNPQRVLDVDGWDELTPSERRRLLQRLRENNPAQARDLLQERLAALPAEQRLSILDVLLATLSDDDLPLLDGLRNDRSEKVRQRASQLRRRLGAREVLDETLRNELRDDFVLASTGLIRRKVQVSWIVLKTGPQRVARQARLHMVGWADIAEVLELAPEELARAFVFAQQDHDDAVLIHCAAQTATARVIELLLERLLFELSAGPSPLAWGALLDRLGKPERLTLAMRCLREKDKATTFAQLLAMASAPFVDVPPSLLKASTAWRRLLEGLAGATAEQAASRPAWLARELAAAGCLLPAVIAREALRECERSGLHAADPMLDVLHFNALLDDSSSTSGHSP